MSLTAGTRLGPYEVLAAIGAGGMGEVYRARDTRLERTVAIKILPPDRHPSPEARQRFEREARTVSQLSHPHICALYDIGTQETAEGRVDFLVMEYLEGETLAARLQRGPLPLAAMLRHAVEIAGALDRAHRDGIVHRDLKPANVMLTRAGVKLLDFGLAKAATSPTVTSTLSGLPTGTQVTQEGAIVGTLQYMAPEQVEGREADARSDLFAFGTVLYEMATGRKAFTGGSQASLISAILASEPPPISGLQPASPPALDRLVAVCLAKDPENRWQSARDLGRELRFLAEGGVAVTTPAAGAAGGPGTRRAGWLALAAGVAVTAGALGGAALRGWWTPPVARPALMRLSLNRPEGTDLVTTLAVSPDGERVAMAAVGESGVSQIWIRPIGAPSASALAGTEGAQFPFWSPDSRSIGFYSESKLWRVGIAGGDVQPLAEITDFRGGAWGSRGDILFTVNATEGLFRVAESGGAVSRVTSLDAGRRDETHRWPSFLPDGRRFLFLVVGREPGIYLGSLEGTPPRRILPDVLSAAIHATPGSLLYTTGQSLLARDFDPATGELRGDPIPIAEGIWRDPTIWGETAFSASADGVIVYRSGLGGETQLTWFDRSGENLGTVGPTRGQSEPSFDPSMTKAVLSHIDRDTGRQDLWIHDLVRGGMARFTGGTGVSGAQTPVWSPDGRSVVYSGTRGDGWALMRRTVADAGGAEETLMQGKDAFYADDWSSDDRSILYERVAENTKYDLWVFDLQTRQPRRLLGTEFNESHATFSPDGRHVAYVSDESGRGEVHVQGFPTAGTKSPISAGGGDQPRWRQDGRELFYIAPNSNLMSVEVKNGPSGLDFSVPKRLFSTNIPQLTVMGMRNSYLVADNGRRFLVMTVPEAGSDVQVVVNWPEALRRGSP